MLQLSQIDRISLMSFMKTIVLYGIQAPEHKVMSDTPYRLWNLATTTLLQRDSNNIISCNGSFKDMDYASKYPIDQNFVPY